MGFLDSLLGRTKLPPANEDRVFSMSTAVITLEAAGGLSAPGRVGIIFKALPPGRFDQLTAEVVATIQIQDASSPSDALHVTEQRDDLGFEWMVIQGADFGALLASIHLVAESLLGEGLGDCLLAAVFPFAQAARTVYWVYAYKDATFYPFVPIGDHRRDNAEEMRLAALGKEDLPVEPQLEKWFPLWGVPL